MNMKPALVGFLKWFTISLGLALFLASIALFALFRFLATESGTEWSLAKATEASDIQITWSEIGGNLIDGLTFVDLEVSMPGLIVRADSVVSGWDIYGIATGELFISEFEVNRLQVAVSENPEATGQSTEPVWPSVELPVAVSIYSSRISGLEYQDQNNNLAIDSIEFAGRLKGRDLRIDQLAVQQGSNGVDLTADLELNLPYPLSATASWRMNIVEQPELMGRVDLNGDISNLDFQHSLILPLEISTSGSLDTGFDANIVGLDPANFQFEIQNTWQLVSALVPTTDLIITSAGELNLQGGVSSYQLYGDLELALPANPNIPQVSVTLDTAVTDMDMAINELAVVTDLGRAQINGDFSYGEGMPWDLDLQLFDLDPSVFAAELPGNINLQLESSGSFLSTANSDEASLQGVINLVDLQGDIRGYQVSAAGAISAANNNYRGENLVFRVGGNELLLSVAVDQTINANWQINAPNLAALYPEVEGSLYSEGSATGALDRPDIEARIALNALQYQNIRLQEFAGFVRAEGVDQYLADLSLRGLIYDTQPSVDAQLELSGNPDQHSYRISLDQNQNAAEFAGSGSFGSVGWQSQLSALTLVVEPLGQWDLTAPADISLNEQKQIGLSELCLAQELAEICTELEFSELLGLDLQAEISSLPISLFKQFFPDGTEFKGSIQGSAQASGTLDSLQAAFSLASPRIELVIQTPELPETYIFEDNQIEGTYQSNRLGLDLYADMGATGALQAALDLAIGNPDAELTGNIEAKFSELSWLDPFLPNLSELEGETEISLQIAGTQKTPLVSGGFFLSDLSAYVPELGISLSQTSLQAVKSADNLWFLQGQLFSDSGSLELSGEAGFESAADWSANIQLIGEQLLAYSMEPNSLRISPDLSIQASPEAIRVAGQVVLPSARIELTKLPATTTRVSADEIILNQVSEEAESPESAIPVYADVTLVLGEEVEFSGFDVSGSLRGQLRLRENPTQTLRADGNIDIADGLYSIYGQELTIDPGQLIFNGSVANPSLNIRASRQVGENLVGVQIGGTANALSSSLYSSPTLASTEAITLLVTGRPLSNASSDDGQLIANAVTALGINQSAAITQRLQASLGLDLLTISPDDNIEGSAITIGKYLSPRLFISYAKDILTPDSSVSLDYRVSDSIEINAKSGTSQSMDIYYRIKH